MTGIELSIQRKSLGYTQAELATLIGASRATVSRWESSETVKYLVVSFMLGLQPKVTAMNEPNRETAEE